MNMYKKLWIRPLQMRSGKMVSLILTPDNTIDSLLDLGEILHEFSVDTDGQDVREFAMEHAFVDKLESIDWGQPISVEGWKVQM